MLAEEVPLDKPVWGVHNDASRGLEAGARFGDLDYFSMSLEVLLDGQTAVTMDLRFIDDDVLSGAIHATGSCRAPGYRDKSRAPCRTNSYASRCVIRSALDVHMGQ